jgi:integrase
MTPRKKDVLPRTKSPSEWQQLFACIETRYPTQARNHALLLLTYVAGLRIGETLALRLKDIDLELGRVTVTEGKSGQRIVPLPPDREDLERSIARWLEHRQDWSPESDLLFVTRPGAPLRASAVRRSMSAYAERCEIGHATPHQLRHSAATELLGNGASPIGVQRVLGHRSLATTLTTYAHAADQHAAEAMSRR